MRGCICILLYVPDEELGDIGMGSFIETYRFRDINIGFALDEGLANFSETFSLFNGERFRIRIDFVGNTGDGSRFTENSCGEKMAKFLQTLHKFRESQMNKLKTGGTCCSLGGVSTLNLTMATGCFAYNVVSQKFSIVVDFRVAYGY